MRLVKLVDGREVDSAGEEYRHECEARAIMDLRSTNERRAWLEGIEKKRGQAARLALQDTIKALWPSR